MADPAIPDALPPDQDGRPLRISPTDVSQFVRLEQCERYLRFRLAERDGQKFMRAYNVTPQRITPLLTRAGLDFEGAVERRIAREFRHVHYAKKADGEVDRPDDNAAVVEEAQALAPGAVVVLFQPRLRVEVAGWLIRGDVDLLRLERRGDGTLHALIADMKSTAEVKVEHRLQVAFYHLMLDGLFRGHGLACDRIETGIIFRGEAEATGGDGEIEAFRGAARRWLGLDDALLELVADPDAYLRSAHDLVTGPDSAARRVARAPFEDVPFTLNYKCDGCLYNEFCMKWSAEHEDLSLLPHLAGVEKEALRRDGITTIRSLAALKDFAPGEPGRRGDLVPAPGREAQVRRLAATWPVGPRLDELVHRARSFRRRVRKDGTAALGYIPGKGASSLPVSTADLNPNLVRVYIDAQHDYLNDRLYLLGGLVVACRDGSPDPRRRRAVVRMTEGPPREASRERQLLIDWTRDLLEAVVTLAAGAGDDARKSAPIHLIFFNRYEQRTLLEALARNFPPLVEASPPLYDFLTHMAAFGEPVATFLDEEIKAFKNFPMTCQSLQSLATYLKFDWNAPRRFRDLFKARLFDYLGKLEIDGQPEWFTRRSRFNSQIPLEYAYAAWGGLPPPSPGEADDFSDFRPATTDLLKAFQVRRLEALEHVADTCGGDPSAEKTPFLLPDLANYQDKARDLAQALHEFVTIERHVALAGWRRIRHAPAERRVLMGETLLARYVEADQDPDVAAQVREHRRRHRLRQEYEAAYQAAHPDAGRVQLPKEQSRECQWSSDGLTVRLRLETVGLDCDLHDALALTTLRAGDRLVVYPRWAVDERLPEADREGFPPSPKQMLYGDRAELTGLVTTGRDESGRITAGHVVVRLREAFGGEWGKGYVFGAIARPLEDGRLYTLDECPNDWYGLWCREVVEGLCRGEPNALYDRIAHPSPSGHAETAPPGQARFLAGLYAFQAAEHLHDFEKSKRAYIGGHGHAPVLLVQGPPGTGKSYSTAFAVFARIQGAMLADEDCRVFAGCKTHAATDVLMKGILQVRETLRGLRESDPERFQKFFDARLLDVPIYRVAPHDPPPDGVVHLIKDAEKARGEPKNADVVRRDRWAVVAATPGGVYGMLKQKYGKEGMFRQEFCDCLVLDEASQMNLPEAVMAALALRPGGPLIVVGDHRQMPPIVQHDWDGEPRRTFRDYAVYVSLFDTLRRLDPPMIRFAESFRLHAAIADFLRREVYRHDGIPFHSRKTDVLPSRTHPDELVASVLRPEYPLTLIVHDEASSQMRNPFEQALIEPILRVLTAADGYGLDAETGVGVVVPHRAQRAALQQAFPELCVLDPASGLSRSSAIDTVERFQGGERTVILVSATESDRAYLLASSEFLLDPRRLTVALSRAKRKMILVASRSIFSVFSPDEEVFLNSQLWKNLLLRTCTTPLWEGERAGKRVTAWGGRAAHSATP